MADTLNVTTLKDWKTSASADKVKEVEGKLGELSVLQAKIKKAGAEGIPLKSNVILGKGTYTNSYIDSCSTYVPSYSEECHSIVATLNLEITVKTGKLSTQRAVKQQMFTGAVIGGIKDILKGNNADLFISRESLTSKKDFSETLTLEASVVSIYSKTSAGECPVNLHFTSYKNGNYFKLSSKSKYNTSIMVPADCVCEDINKDLARAEILRQEINDIITAPTSDGEGVSDTKATYLELKDENDITQFQSQLVQVPSDEHKANTLDSAVANAEGSRKLQTIEVNKGSHRASIIRKALSESDMNKASNRQEDPGFDKRRHNVYRGCQDIYGMRAKLDAPGCIRLYKANGSTGYEDPVSIDCFLLQSVQSSLKEKFSIFQSLSGDILAYFFGKQPIMYRYQAALYNTYNQEWFQDFKFYYENYLRGSASIGKNIRTVISYENHVIEGFFLEMNMQESTTNTNLVNIDFSILFIQDHIINYDQPVIQSMEAVVEGADAVSSSSVDRRAEVIPAGTTVAQPENSVISVIAKNGATLVSDSQGSKTIAPGETIKVVDPPRSDDKGENYYAVEAGSYNDAEGNPQAVNSSYRIKADDVIKEETGEESLSDRKIIDLKNNPEAFILKPKSDIDPQSREYEKNDKIVAQAEQQVEKKTPMTGTRQIGLEDWIAEKITTIENSPLVGGRDFNFSEAMDDGINFYSLSATAILDSFRNSNMKGRILTTSATITHSRAETSLLKLLTGSSSGTLPGSILFDSHQLPDVPCNEKSFIIVYTVCHYNSTISDSLKSFLGSE